eukprot:tig00021246_g19607.t1
MRRAARVAALAARADAPAPLRPTGSVVREPPSYAEFLEAVLSPRSDALDELDEPRAARPAMKLPRRGASSSPSGAWVLAEINNLFLQPSLQLARGQAQQLFTFAGVKSLDEDLIPRVRRPWTKAARSMTAARAAAVIEGADEQAMEIVSAQHTNGLDLLRSLGCSDAELHQVARKCPAILLLPLDEYTYKLVSVLVGAGLGKDGLRAIFVADPLLIRRDPERVKRKLEFLGNVGLGTEEILALLRGAPFVLHGRAATLRENFELLAAAGFAPEPGAPHSILKLLQSHPRVLTSDTARLADRLRFLQHLLGPSLVPKASKHVDLLLLDVESCLRPKVEALAAFGFDEADVRRAFRGAPQLASVDVPRHLREKEALLHELAGLSRGDCVRVFSNAPGTLLLTPQTLRAKLEALGGEGFTREQLRRVLLGCTKILTLCFPSNILPKLRWLRSVAGVQPDEIVGRSNVLGMSLEGRLAPRHGFLRARGRLPAPGEPLLARLWRFEDGEWARRVAGAEAAEFAAWRAAAPRAAMGLPRPGGPGGAGDAAEGAGEGEGEGSERSLPGGCRLYLDCIIRTEECHALSR